MPVPEMQRIRDGLERVLGPAASSSVVFDALEHADGVPTDRATTLALLRGPIAAVLVRRVGEARAASLLRSLELELGEAEAEADELDVEIELDDEEEADEDAAQTRQMLAVPHSVSVLIVAGADGFAQRLLTAIGADRVWVHEAHDEAQLRHAVFSAEPLVVIVDAVTPPAIRPVDVAAELARLPDATVSVLWGDETDYGRAARARAEQIGARVVFLPRSEGTEPLLDLVLSRQRSESGPPPPL